jgi:hypothetical protein
MTRTDTEERVARGSLTLPENTGEDKGGKGHLL